MNEITKIGEDTERFKHQLVYALVNATATMDPSFLTPEGKKIIQDVLALQAFHIILDEVFPGARYIVPKGTDIIGCHKK